MNFTGIGYGIMSIMLVTSSSALSLIYYLKLKYAERYGLEEYLPTRLIMVRIQDGNDNQSTINTPLGRT